MQAREGRIESTAPDTGDWLLKSQDFQDWAQRKRLDEHHGFFWIQGNPGSGKSTLIKKAYSHMQALSRDPTSVIAAFYFNARGSEMEKSPTGLFRTLLYTLSQHISALRAQVMRIYHRKCKLLSPNWEWQLHELKELLTSVVTASTLGQRNLIICVDALDECDLLGAKSVIQFFEHLAISSVRENTKFNICLSSRYWPQFTIQHCFKSRVEIENHGDIASYIQQQMEAIRSFVDEKNQLDVLESKLRDKAKGTFLWVVLVVQELLTAYESGATLGEIDKILDDVPPDLSQFYQHQIKNTKYDDRHQMLSMLQCVFYSMRPLLPTELRCLLAFGHKSFSSYSEWAQSSDYVVSDAQMEKRIREKSKGLLEIAELPELPEDHDGTKLLHDCKRIVQFIHQSVRDFLSKDGLEPHRRREMPSDAASGHEFMKIACFNYLNTTDLKKIPIIDFRFYTNDGVRRKMPNLPKNHSLLEYAVDHLFPHAALAEKHGIRQDDLRSHMSDDIQGSFERWKYLHDLIHIQRDSERPNYGNRPRSKRGVQGPEARPLHIFAQYGLLALCLRKPKENPNTQGGLYDYPLFAAAAKGHKDVVRYLLNSGADLQTLGPAGETAYHWAAAHDHVDVLEILLEQPSSIRTLQQRIEVARYEGVINRRNNSISARQVQETLALLIPEASIPFSAIDGICNKLELEVESSFIHEPLLHVILDKCESEIYRSESFLYKLVAHTGVRAPIIEQLLSGMQSIKIGEHFFSALKARGAYRREDTEKIATILLEHGNVKVTESFVNHLCLFQNSSQLLRQLAAAGHEIPSITCHQTMSALSNGSLESASFFIQHAPDDASSDEMLLAAVQNQDYATQVVRMLLGLRSIKPVSEILVTLSLQNWVHGLSLLETFEDRWGTLVLSADTMVSAWSRTCRFEAMEFVLKRCEGFSLSESVAIIAMRKAFFPLHKETMNMLLELDSTFQVQDRLIAKTVAEPHRQGLLEIYHRHGSPLLLSEKVVRAAARNHKSGVEALEIVLQHNSDVEFSDTMVLEALHSSRGAALITLMLESDPSIAMQEDYLIVAASNPNEGALIFEALHQKDRISFCSSTIRTTHARSAKRQRISSEPLRSLRDRRIKSAQITRKIIKAAAANKEVEQRRQLLSLFDTWGVLTEKDRRLF